MILTVTCAHCTQLTGPDARQWQEEFGRGTRFQIFRVPLSRQYQTMEFSKVRWLEWGAGVVWSVWELGCRGHDFLSNDPGSYLTRRPEFSRQPGPIVVVLIVICMWHRWLPGCTPGLESPSSD